MFMKNQRSLAVIVMLLAVAGAVPAWSHEGTSYAGVGFMGLSPNLIDTMDSWSIADTLYGGTVSFAVNSWFSVGADVLYLGDIYYEKDALSGDFSGPLPWSKLDKTNPTVGDFFESLMYAPLTFNITIPLGFLKPYIGAGPAFYFHFPSTNADDDFTAYLQSRYGDGERIRTGITARAGFDIFFADSFSLGAGYFLREDTPGKLFDHLAVQDFYLENGYIFLVGRTILQ
ncbi:MAG: outer membrane beta-barrel protein [Rectinemataceae bacterium]|nr:outer membrane beta-barrel protein [Rectinemataceae bacterium]